MSSATVDQPLTRHEVQHCYLILLRIQVIALALMLWAVH